MNWVKEDLSKFPKRKRKKEENSKKTVEMWRLCQAGLFFLR